MRPPKCKGGILTPRPVYAQTECTAGLGVDLIRDRKPSDPCPHVSCPDDRCVFIDEARIARLPRAQAGHMLPATALLSAGLVLGGGLVAAHPATALCLLIAAVLLLLARSVWRAIRELEAGR